MNEIKGAKVALTKPIRKVIENKVRKIREISAVEKESREEKISPWGSKAGKPEITLAQETTDYEREPQKTYLETIDRRSVYIADEHPPRKKDCVLI